MSTAVVFQQMIVIVIMIIIGYCLYKSKKITDEGSKTMSFLVVNVTNPCMAVSSAFSDQLNITHEDIIIGILTAFAMFLIFIAMGHGLSAAICRNRDDRRAYIMLQVYSNVGFMGMPVVAAVLGSQNLVFVSITVIVYNLLFYTHGYTVMLSGREGIEFKISWRTFINVGTVSGIIAIVIFWFGLRFPAVIEDTISYAGRATTFMAMIVLGISMAKVPIRSMFSDKRLYIIWAVRYLVLPVAFSLALKGIMGDTLLVKTMGILSAMPVGNMPLMLANQYKLETRTLSAGTFLTTVLSVFTVTLTTMVL